jgi:hypothetical protein
MSQRGVADARKNFSITGRSAGSSVYDGPEPATNSKEYGFRSNHRDNKRLRPGSGTRPRLISERQKSGNQDMGRLARFGASNLKLGQDFPSEELFSGEPVQDLTATFSLRFPSKTRLSQFKGSGFRSSPTAAKSGGDVIVNRNGKNISSTSTRASQGYHIKTTKNTWETVGVMKSPLERPITRKEVEALSTRFTAALAHINENDSSREREVNPVFEQDLMQIQSEITALYSSLEEKHTNQEKSMVHCLFTQKWTDLIFGELSDQLNVTCLEQGLLLQKIRVQFARICESYRRSHDMGIQELKDHEREMRQMRVQLADIKQKHQYLENNFEQKQADAIAQVTAGKDQEISLVKDDLYAQVENCDQLHTSLKTLNGLFNAMRDNQEGLRIGDLREANSRLQALLTHRDKELEALRPLENECADLKEQVSKQQDQIEKLRENLIVVSNKLNEQQHLNKDLMSKEEYRLESLEKMLNGTKEDMALDPEGTQAKFEKAASRMQPINLSSQLNDQVSPENVLCVRCQRTLKAARNLDMFDDHLGEKKLLCESFRILLPNLMGQRPVREKEWTLRCIRAIVFAKQRETAASQRASRPPVRLPEFVYGWFFPRVQALARGDKEAMIAEAEENMWGFYYSLKRLAKELPECRLFFTMLNETYAEDDLSFFLYCVQTIRGVARDDVAEAWGEEVISSDDYTAILDLEEKHGGLIQITERVWISVESAMYSIERVMARSTERDRDQVIKKVAENAERSEGRLGEDPDKEDLKCIDSSFVVQLLMEEYRGEQAMRTASLKVMFETASVAAQQESEAPNDRTSNGKTVDMQQFIEVIRSINSNSRIEMIATLYRDAYDFSNIGGVDLHAFLYAANKNHFFTSCQRLPVFYGAQNAEILSSDDHQKLRFVMIRHIRMFAGFVAEASHLIGPKRAATIHKLQSILEDDLAGTVDGDGDGPDPQRLLCGFRRLLDELMSIRMQGLENYGERSADGKLIHNVERELDALENILTQNGFAVGPGQGASVTGRMKQLLLKLSAIKIQRSWKRNAAEHPVPLNTRRLMSRQYAASTDPMMGISRHRRVKRPLCWVILLIREIFTARYEELFTDSEANVSISFSRFVYNFMVKKFGNFHLAERHLHDLFTSAWSMQAKQALCRLFLMFVTDGTSVDSPEYGESEAIEFYLKAAGTLAGQNVDSLFPFPSDLDTCTVAIDMDRVTNTITSIFPKHVRAALLGRLQLISMEAVDLDNCLLMFVEAWLTELRAKQNQIVTLLSDPSTGNDAVSLDTFHDFLASMEQVANHLNLDVGKVMPNITIDLYIEAVRQAKSRGFSKIDVIVWASRRRHFVYWNLPLDNLKRLPSLPKVVFSFLEMSWEAYRLPTGILMNDLSALIKADRGVELTHVHMAKFRKIYDDLRQDLDCRRKQLDAGEEELTMETVETTWQLFRDCVGKLQNCHSLAGLGSTLRDAYDLKQEGLERTGTGVMNANNLKTK